MIAINRNFSLQIKDKYIVKTDMLKNSTHQTYKWREIAISNNRKELEKYANENLNKTQEYRIKPRY